MSVIDADTMRAGMCVDECYSLGYPCSTCKITQINPHGKCVSTCRACERCYTQYNECVDNCAGTNGACFCGIGGLCIACETGYDCRSLGGSRGCEPPIVV
jgi:hypothetical protein